MGVFDEVTCKFKLPWPEVQDAIWQSKQTPVQYLDHYEIREDGTLWHEAYDLRVEETDEAPLGVWMYRDNPRWVLEPFTGELEIHEYREHSDRPGGWWYSVRFWFRAGKVADAVFRKCGRDQ